MPDDIRPLRVTMTDIDTGDSISAQFNPTEISERIGAAYNKLEIMGLSHRPLQFQGTENLELNFELGFDARSAGGENVQRARRFLHAACYSRKGAQDIIGGAPPKILFSWPGLYSIQSVVETVDIRHKHFNRAMKNVIFAAQVKISEVLSVRIYSEDVLTFGTFRS